MFNSADIKTHFPIFEHYPDLVFADNASTTQKPSQVIDVVSNYYQTSNANVHRGVYDLAIKSDKIYAGTRNKLCQFFNKEEAIFTNGTTDGLNKIARSLEHMLKKGDNIIVSEMEHHSNLVPWQELCRRKGLELRVIGITDDGNLDLENLGEQLDDRTRIISLVHISNTLGTMNDLSRVAALANEHDCYFIVDAAQSCALHREEISELDADAFVFGAHKMFGPSGLGVILAKTSFLSALEPFNYGGGMVTEVEKHRSIYRDDLSRFEAGTPAIAQVAGLSAALDFLGSLDLGQCKNHVSNLGHKLRVALESKDVSYLGSFDLQATGIVSATFGDIHPHDVASFLNTKNISVRAGHHCTQLIMKKYGIYASVRFSFSIYNHESEIDHIVKSLAEMKEYFL